MKKLINFVVLCLLIVAFFCTIHSAYAEQAAMESGKIIGYNMVYYCTKEYSNEDDYFYGASEPDAYMFRDYSVIHSPAYFGDDNCSEHLTRFVTAGELLRAEAFPADRSFISISYNGQTRSGYQMGDGTAYNFGDDNYVWYVASAVSADSPELTIGYNMRSFCTKSEKASDTFMFRDYSIKQTLSENNADFAYGEEYRTRYVTVDELIRAAAFSASGTPIEINYDGQTRYALPMGTTTAYDFGDDGRLWFVESAVTVPDPYYTDDSFVDPAAEESGDGTHPKNVTVEIGHRRYEIFSPTDALEEMLVFQCDTPVVSIEGRKEASQKINRYLKTLEGKFFCGSEDIYGSFGLNGSLKMKRNEFDIGYNYTSAFSAVTSRLDQKCINFIFRSVVNFGGAETSYYGNTYVFDSETGERVTLDMLSPDPAALRSFLADELERVFDEDKDGYYSQKYASCSVMDERCEYHPISTLLRDRSWYFDEEGMCIFADPYECAGSVYGFIEFHIPYASLAGHIDDKWFPEKMVADGTVSVSYSPKQDDGRDMEIKGNYTYDEGGTNVFIKADGCVYQLSLSGVAYSEWSDEYYETNQVWASSYLENGALRLTVKTETKPFLLLRYSDCEGKEHSFYLEHDILKKAPVLISTQEYKKLS